MGKRIICIDETWVDSQDYRQRKWRPRGEPNSVEERNVRPRISLILAVDTAGAHYMSLAQSNVDGEIFMLFLRQLFDLLHAEDANFRDHVVLQLDGAAYHKSGAVRDFLRNARVKVLLMAPYAYETCKCSNNNYVLTAVCELWFSSLKSVNLNPKSRGMSKKYFAMVVGVILKRGRQITCSNKLRFWHKILEGVFAHLVHRHI